MTSERRIFSRHAFITRCDLLREGEVVAGTLKNLSLAGLLFETAETPKLQADDEVTVRLVMPADGENLMSVEMPTRVMRLHDREVAVQFDPRQMTVESLIILKTLVMVVGSEGARIEREFAHLLAEIEKTVWEE